jgi:hypothetical protein
MSETGKAVLINDAHLYKVELVVSIPNYSCARYGNQHTITATDFILDVLSNEVEITVLDVKETKLGLVVS